MSKTDDAYDDKKEAISVRGPSGEILTLLKSEAKTVGASSYGTRNTGCSINGVPVAAAYDSVINALGWHVEDIR